MISRRAVIRAAGAIAALSLPSIAAPTRAQTLRFVPQSNLTALDPLWTTAGVTLNHGYCVFDTLYGVDESFQVHPQMAEGHSVSDDGLTWLIRLRNGLRFHDGEPVRAADCAASLARWSKRDTFGQTLASSVVAWESADDQTVRIRLNRPFPKLLDALAHPGPIVAFVMPERLARTDPFKQVAEMVGSGPYRFIPAEYVSGSQIVYERFDGYVPSQGTPVWNSGAKVPHFDRIEWHIIPDPATTASALQTGEVDWWEGVSSDLEPLLARNPAVALQTSDPLGSMYLLRFNSIVPPFDNAALRRAVLSAVDQDDYMQAISSGGSGSYRTCYSMFPSGLPFVREIGADLMRPPKNLAGARRAIEAAGYAAERVVILNPSDLPGLAQLGEVTADLLKRLGMNVDLQSMDWGTVGQRRTSREPVERGGWNIFHTSWPSVAIANPALNTNIRGLGKAGWFGWFDSPDIERLTAAWLDSTSADEQQRLFDAIQRVAFEQVPIVPLGITVGQTAFRKDITGILPGPAVFSWNVRRT